MPRDPRQHQHYDPKRGRIVRPRERKPAPRAGETDLLGEPTADRREHGRSRS